MVFKNQNIPLFVRRICPETSSHWSIFFDRPKNFEFEAGDWIDIQFEGRQLSGGITYSISSSPLDSEIRITFREGISEFKRALQAVSEGDRMTITQFGNDYDFRLKQNHSSVLMAGGVGIAPFRSMLHQMYQNNARNEVVLIYLNKNDDYLFKDELGAWSRSLPHLTISYIFTDSINRKKRENLIRGIVKHTNQNFYISGPPGMVETNEHLLIDMGVRERDIRIDSFGGY